MKKHVGNLLLIAIILSLGLTQAAFAGNKPSAETEQKSAQQKDDQKKSGDAKESSQAKDENPAKEQKESDNGQDKAAENAKDEGDGSQSDGGEDDGNGFPKKHCEDYNRYECDSRVAFGPLPDALQPAGAAQVNAVPEPSTLPLFGAALGGWLAIGKGRRKAG